MQTTELDRERLERIAGLHSDGQKVLSLFLNLDPSTLPTTRDRESAITSVLDEADRRVEAQELPHAARMALRRDAQRIREYLTSDEFSPRGGHGMAVFSAGGGEHFEVVKLPRPVPQQVVVDDIPWIEPLAHQLAGPSLLVVLVDRRRARLMRGTSERLEEVGRVRDDVHRQHDQGGLSQPRYQRAIEEEVHHHLRHTAEQVHRADAVQRFDRLIVGTTAELMHAFEAELRPNERERLLGRVDIDLETASPDAVRDAVAPLVELEERRRAHEAVERLEARLGTGGAAASGLADVLEALTERRVETLLYAQGFSAPGAVCPRCGWLGPPTERCPVDGSATEAREDILDDAVEAALEQSADVISLPEPELRGHGPIAAVLRF